MQASHKKARTDVAETDSITVNPNSMRLVYQRLQELEAELKRNGIPLPPSEALRQVLFGPRTPTVIWKLIFSFHTFQINPIDIISCENVPEEIKLREMCKTFHLALPIPNDVLGGVDGICAARLRADSTAACTTGVDVVFVVGAAARSILSCADGVVEVVELDDGEDFIGSSSPCSIVAISDTSLNVNCLAPSAGTHVLKVYRNNGYGHASIASSVAPIGVTL